MADQGGNFAEFDLKQRGRDVSSRCGDALVDLVSGQNSMEKARVLRHVPRR